MDPTPPEVAPEDAPGGLQEEEEADEERWSRLLPELLTNIVRCINTDIVRRINAAISVVCPLLECGRITFPSSVKQVDLV
ncbi:tubby-like F-box protein 9 [Hordeum vulgare]|nr:tubby-like F-box protein 9 [Hordeum vulgare]